MRERGHGFYVSYIDQLWVLMGAFMLLAAFVAIKIPKQDAFATNTLIMRTTWPIEHDCDVDGWLQPPGDRPVGFYTGFQHGKHGDLVHDDLGRSLTVDSRNEELIEVRSTPQGEYVANVMLYSATDNKFPVQPVHVEVWSSKAHGVILSVDGVLTHVKQEVTLARFRLDADGNLVPGSVSHLYKHLFPGDL